MFFKLNPSCASDWQCSLPDQKPQKLLADLQIYGFFFNDFVLFLKSTTEMTLSTEMTALPLISPLVNSLPLY